MQRNDISGVRAMLLIVGKSVPDTGKEMLIGPEIIGKGVVWGEGFYFPSPFPPYEQCLPVRF